MDFIPPNVMAGAIDLENLQLIFDNCTAIAAEKSANKTYFIGQVVYMQLCCKISAETLAKFKTSYPPRSPISQNVLSNLRRQLAGSVEVRCSVRGINKNLTVTQDDNQGTGYKICKVVGCFTGDDKNLAFEPFLSEDKRFYHIPLEVRIPDISLECRKAELHVHVRPSSKLGPRWLSSPTKPESPSFDDLEPSASQAGKIVTQTVKIIHPPKILAHQSHVGNQEMVFLKVKNSSTYPIEVLECSVLPEACPKSAIGSQFCSSRQESSSVCMFHAGMAALIPVDDSLLPVSLRPGECISLCYVLNLIQFEASFSKDDVTLEAQLKWSIHSTSETAKQLTMPVITIYRLHSLKLRKGLFVISAVCDERHIKKGQSFSVTYTIHNRLQDFLSIKLHWSPQLTDDGVESVRQFEKIQTCLICHDPSVQLGEMVFVEPAGSQLVIVATMREHKSYVDHGDKHEIIRSGRSSCQYGDTVQAKVSFCAISKGVYEVCKHMKINLRYLIPGSDNNSLASPTSQSSSVSEDRLSVVPDQIWRTRSGSGTSFTSPRPTFDLRRTSSSSKSHSFDDLGPINDDDVELFKKPKDDKSTALPRRDPKLNVMSTSKYEQMLLSPGNFIKNSCLVMVE